MSTDARDLAVALRARGEIEQALVHAREAVARDASAPALALLASLHALQGDRETAIATLRRAVAVDPRHVASRYYLGVLVAPTDCAEALSQLHHVIARGSPALRERARLQLSDLLASDAPPTVDLCSVPLVDELATDGERTTMIGAAMGRTIAIDEAREIVRGARSIVALTGAGISSASGLATRKELWQRHDRDRAVSIVEFRRDPLPLWTVIREFLGDGVLVPNAAHRALAAMPLAGVITQNVEGLHQAAGSANVIELHGTLLATRCDACGARGPSCVEVHVPACACGAVMRPDVVLFGERVDREVMTRAGELVARCDLLLVVGTAADVAPAADLPLLAMARGSAVIEIKRTASRLVRGGALHLAGIAEEILPELL